MLSKPICFFNAVVVILVITPGLMAQPAAHSDPLYALLAEYHTASDEMRSEPSPEKGRAFDQEWFDRLSAALQAHPKAHGAWDVRWALIGIANSLERYQESLELLNEALRKARTKSERALVLDQMILVNWDAYLDTKQQAYADAAVRTLEELRRFSRENEMQGWYVYSLGKAAQIHEMKILALVRAGASDEVVKKQHAQAAALYAEAVREFRALPPDQKEEENLDDYNKEESLLWSATLNYANAGMVAEALDTMKQITSLQDRRQTLGRYWNILMDKDPAYVAKADEWLRTLPQNEDGAFLAFELAHYARYREHDLPKAAAYLDMIHEHYQAALDAEERFAAAVAEEQAGIQKKLHGDQ